VPHWQLPYASGPHLNPEDRAIHSFPFSLLLLKLRNHKATQASFFGDEAFCASGSLVRNVPGGSQASNDLNLDKDPELSLDRILAY
jgi:hypothetical protein